MAWPFRSHASRNSPFGLCLAPLPHTESAVPIVLPSRYRETRQAPLKLRMSHFYDRNEIRHG